MALYIPICPRCGEGKVLVCPSIKPPDDHARLDDFTFYCDKCTHRFTLNMIQWKAL